MLTATSRRTFRPSNCHLISLAAFVGLTLSLMLLPAKMAYASTTNTRADAWGTLEVGGSSWLNGGGVDIYSNGSSAAGPSPDTYNYINNINGTSTQSGIKWQCVEMVNRLYLTKGWTTSTWTGNGYQLYGNMPSSLTEESQGSVTYVNPGDVIAMSGGSDGNGHVAVVDSVNGSTFTIASQNTVAVYDTSFGLSSGSVTKSGWSSYTIQGVVHNPGGYETAFQANNNYFYTYSPGSTTGTTLGMASGTSPSIARLANGVYESAFQANNGNLYVYNPTNGATNLSQGMASGTSPSITAFPGGGWEIAFQDNNGNLHLYNSTNGATSLSLGMKTGTSPSVTAMPNNTFQVAFQVNTGSLYTYNQSNGATNLSQGMASGTSPSITAFPGGGWEIAFQNNIGNLHLYNSTNGAQTLSLGMASGTSPSIVALTNSWFEAAFQANTGSLYAYSNTGGSTNLSQGMATSTSPSIAALSNTAWEISFQANNNNLYVYNSSNGANGLTLGMLAGTSPGITGR